MAFFMHPLWVCKELPPSFKAVHNREWNRSGKQNSFDRPNIKGTMLKKNQNLRQHECSKHMREWPENPEGLFQYLSLFLVQDVTLQAGFNSVQNSSPPIAHSPNSLGSLLHATVHLSFFLFFFSRHNNSPPLFCCQRNEGMYPSELHFDLRVFRERL